MKIFRSIGKLAGQAARSLKPKRLSVPTIGLRHLARKHGLKATLLTGGVAVGSGTSTLVELAKGPANEQPPIILIGNKLSDQIMENNPWNMSHFNKGNQIVPENETTDSPTMSAHSDTQDHGQAHHGHHEVDFLFLSKIKAALILLTMVALICGLIKLGRIVGKWMKRWYRIRRDRTSLRDIPRLEAIQHVRRRQARDVPQQVYQQTPSPCPSYGTAMAAASAPIPGMAFHDEMMAAQETLRKTQAVNPTPRSDYTADNEPASMEAVLRDLESHPDQPAQTQDPSDPLPANHGNWPSPTSSSRPPYPPPSRPQTLELSTQPPQDQTLQSADPLPATQTTAQVARPQEQTSK